MRTFVVGHAMTLADLNLWSMITTNLNVYKANKQHFPHVDRLYNFLADEPILAKLGRQYATTTAQVRVLLACVCVCVCVLSELLLVDFFFSFRSCFVVQIPFHLL